MASAAAADVVEDPGGGHVTWSVIKTSSGLDLV